MATFLRAVVLAVCPLLALVVCLSATLGAAPQEPPSVSVPSVSLERIRREVEKTPAPLKLDLQGQLPVAVFKTSVDQHVYMLTFEQQLHKEFDLSVIQRQSQEWRSKCCGFNLLRLPKVVDGALKDREARRAREQVARELAEVEAASAKASASQAARKK